MELKQRMYHFVLYSLSGIQKGIQAYHSAIEFQLKYGHTLEYKRWAEIDKTVILLDGGTSNSQNLDFYSGGEYKGSMQTIVESLIGIDVPFAVFHEPDLNNAMTSIAFLVDERVFDKTNYPILKMETEKGPILDIEKEEKVYGKRVAMLRMLLHNRKLA